jgi:ribosomal protein S12 methylthiotransferase accessory factor
LPFPSPIPIPIPIPIPPKAHHDPRDATTLIRARERDRDRDRDRKSRYHPYREGGPMSNNSMTVSFPGGKRVTASYNGFEIVTDQSKENGGDGTAPEPYDCFLASLATCAGIYVLGFCQKRDIPHDGVRVVQSWERDDKSRRLTTVRIAIKVPPDFPVKYHDALVRSANQCAVKKAMEDPPDFQVETVVSS